MTDPCKDCGKVHPEPMLHPMKALAKMLKLAPVFVPFGPGSPFGPPPNPNTAFLRKPLFTKSQPLTSDELRSRFHAEKKRAHHKACRFLVEPDLFLNYVSCGKCKLALGADDVFWKSIYPPKRKKKKKRGKK